MSVSPQKYLTWQSKYDFKCLTYKKKFVIIYIENEKGYDKQMIDKYELTAKLTAPLLQAFREGYSIYMITGAIEDAIAIAEAQYHREETEAKRKKEDAANDRDKMKKLLLASMKALRSIDDDPEAKFITDEYLDNILTDDVIDFASEISKAITNASKTVFDEAFKIQKKEKKNDSTTTHTSNNNTNNDSDSFIIGEWLKHQEW